jgi:predicted SAM-dependent methyltransferase
MKLNLGCHVWKLDGFTNVDIDPKMNPDVLADVLKLPFEDNSVDEIYAGHIIEHLNMKQSEEAIIEWKRVLKVGGIITITIPDFQTGIYMYENDMISQEMLNKIVFGDEVGGVMEHKQVLDYGMLYNLTSKYFHNVKLVDTKDCNYLVSKDLWQSIITAIK